MLPALVIGSSLTALGTVRCLGREGITTFYINPVKDFVNYSRWNYKNDKLNHIASSNLSIGQFLINSDLEGAVLYPCNDIFAHECASLSTDLSERFISTGPPSKILDILLDKSQFAEVLNANSIPHPNTILLKNESSIKQISKNEILNYFIKPTNSQKFYQQYGVKAYHFNSYECFYEKYDILKKDGYQLLLQEYIPGPANQHYYIDGYVNRNDEKRTYFARRRLRMYPADFGNSTFLVSIPLKDVSPALDALDYLFSKIKFYGIFSAEFKWDERDAKFKILEINVRPWWYIEYAAKCGVNVCKLAYDDALGIQGEYSKSYLLNSFLAYPYNDYCALFLKEKKRKIYLLYYMLIWIKSQKPFFTLDDPVPAIVVLIKRIKCYLEKRVQRIFIKRINGLKKEKWI